MVERFSTSLEQGLLKEFDAFILRHGYANRSEAIRDLIRIRLTEEAGQDDRETVIGSISLVYDHHQHRLQDRLTHLQHDYQHLVISTTHVHMDHDHCLEVIIVKGLGGDVRAMADKIIAIRGVRNGTLHVASAGSPSKGR